jgi:hypothetical protein
VRQYLAAEDYSSHPGDRMSLVIVAASTVAVVAVAVAVVAVALVVWYILPRGGRRKRGPRT